MENYLLGKVIKFINNSKNSEGKVILVYNDAIISGTSGYAQFTMLLVEHDDKKISKVLPREVIEIIS